MKRTFIAVDIDAEEKLATFISRLRNNLHKENIRWTGPEKMHLTIAFIGDTEEENVRKICTGLPDALSESSQFNLTIAGLGVVPGPGNPRVLWAGIRDHEPLTSIYIKVCRFLSSIDIKTEERVFKPHLTLGRIKNIENRQRFAGIITEYRDTVFQHAAIKGLTYYQSILGHEGAEYKPLAKISLLPGSPGKYGDNY